MDKAKKKRIKRYLAWLCIAAVVVLLTIMPLLAKSEAEKDGPVVSILSAEAGIGTVSTALHGGGTLEAQEEMTVKIPSGVKITEFLVKNGDVVTAGTPLAAVDKVSVMTAITGVSETLEYLQKEMEREKDEAVAATISATAGGRVKKIFAREGETVQEVMLRDGALAVLSIDGLMAVRLEVPAATVTGESVEVAFPDGTTAAGRVESNLNGVVIVTVEDEGYAIGETVTVEGLGSGRLYVHNAWKATGYSGTISRIHVKEEGSLSAGSTLFTLEDTEYTAQMQHRANQHREYEALLQELMVMYQSGTIDAPCDGVVSGVEDDSPHLLAAGDGIWEAQLLENAQSQGSYRIILLSGSAGVTDPNFPFCQNSEECVAELGQHMDQCPRKCTTNAGCEAKYHADSCITHCTKADQAAACTAQKHYGECIHSCTHGTDATTCTGSKNHYPDCIETCDPAKGMACPAQILHKKTCILRCGHGDTEADCDAEGKHHLDCIHSCDPAKGKACPASKHKTGCYYYGMTYTAYAGKVESVGTAELIVRMSSKLYYVEGGGSSWTISDGAVLDEKLMVNRTKVPNTLGGSVYPGAVILVVTGYHSDGSTENIGTVLYRNGTPSVEIPDLNGSGDFGSLGGFGGMDLSGMIGGFSGFGNYSGTMPQTEDEGLYDLEGSTLLTVTPQDVLTLTISLDEQDISKVQTGMLAEVEIAAIRGKSYEAEVARVGTSGKNNGGSSKFEVELVLEGSRDMLIGMSATVQIPLANHANVCVIPVAALCEDGARTLVYKTLDEETGLPASPVEVETGLSDGESVEILSGLEAGDTIYYSYYDTLELDTSAEAERFTFG